MIDAFKSAAISIKKNPQSHVYISFNAKRELTTTSEKESSLSFYRLTALFENLHKGNTLGFEQLKALQKSFKIIFSAYKLERNENFLKKIIRKIVVFLAQRAISNAPSPIDPMGYHFRVHKRKLRYGLTKCECLAILHYTRGSFSSLNKVLRKSKKADPVQKYLCKHICQGLAKLPPAKGKLYRGTNLKLKKKLTPKAGDLFCDKAFASFSTDKEVARKFAHDASNQTQSILFKVINASRAYSVADFTQVPYEQEHIYLPNQQFRVMKVVDKSDQDGTYTKIVLSEITVK